MNEFSEEQPDPKSIPRPVPEWRRGEHEWPGTPDTDALPFIGEPFSNDSGVSARTIGSLPNPLAQQSTPLSPLSTARTPRTADNPA